MSTLPPPPQEPPSSAESIGGNDDILTEILTHVPTKPLLRFKSVNKQFLSVISHPSFSLLHTLRHPHTPPSALFLLLHHHNNHSTSPSFDFIPLSLSSLHPPSLSSPSHIVQSSNGLLLSLPTPSIHVSNPTTNQTTLIPNPGPAHITAVNLAFDPARWPHYHLLRILVSDQSRFSLETYSSATRAWSPSTARLDDAPFDTEFERGVYWRGRVFWLSHTAKSVYYDIDSDRIGWLNLPKVFDEELYLERFRYFGESCGHLHLVEIRTNCVREFDILEVMEQEQEQGRRELEWFVKYKIDLDLVGVGFEDDMFQDGKDRFGRWLRFYAFSILAVVRGNDNDDDDDDGDGDGDGGSSLVLSIPGKVISYDFKSKVSRLISNVVDDSVKWFPFQPYNAFQFIETLYCP